jgi:outer membrane protein assembly factor BamB
MHCAYCNQGFDLGAPPPLPVAPFGGYAPPPPAYGDPRVQVDVYRAPSPGRYALYFTAPMVLIGISLGISMFASQSAQLRAEEVSRAAAATDNTSTATATTTSTTTNVLWGGGKNDYPVVANIASGEDLVGFYVEGREVELGGFDGTSLTKRWSVGGFGTGPQAREAIVVGAGGKLATADYRGRVRILDARTGAEEGEVTVTDKVESLIPAPGDKPQAWAKIKDGKDVMIDLAARRVTPARRPAWAPEPYFADTHCTFHSPNSRCVESKARAPAGKDMLVDRVLSDADLRVAVTRKHPGTEIAYLLGFREGAKAPLWKTQIVEGDPVIANPGTTIPVELASARVFAVYEMSNGNGTHMTAFDAKTGDRLWNVHLPFSPMGHYSVKATETRVYFPYGSALWVFDSRTGKPIGKIGR